MEPLEPIATPGPSPSEPKRLRRALIIAAACAGAAIGGAGIAGAATNTASTTPTTTVSDGSTAATGTDSTAADGNTTVDGTAPEDCPHGEGGAPGGGGTAPDSVPAPAAQSGNTNT